MSPPLSPVFLLADSELLFRRSGGEPALPERLREHLPEAPRAAYIGAANGDDPVFFGLFEAAMEAAGIRDRRAIPSRPKIADELYLRAADLVLLAGGDVVLGWSVLRATEMDAVLTARYLAGAVLLGVSAGAVHLGMGGPGLGEGGEPLDLLRLVPFAVDVHDEAGGWERLRGRVRALGPSARGLGIAKGGGLVVHPEGILEPLRRPAVEIVLRDGEPAASLLVPGEPPEPGP